MRAKQTKSVIVLASATPSLESFYNYLHDKLTYLHLPYRYGGAKYPKVHLVDMLKEQFNYILIDCPAGVEDGFKNAMAASQEAIVVTNPEVSAVRDADRVIGLLNTNSIKPVQLVLNRVRPKMMANQEMLSIDDVTDILALPLLGLVLEDEQVIVSTNRGEPLTLNSVNSPAAKCYLNIAKRLQGEDIPLIDPAEEISGFGAKFRRLMQTKIF